jgi:hypothetical protein
MEIWRHEHGYITMETWTWRHEHGDMDRDTETSNEKRKWKPRRFSLILFSFAHRGNGSLSFIRLLTQKQKEVIRLRTD